MTAPERIWLQDGGDFDAASEVTWCQHSIDDADTEYIRADLAAGPAQVRVKPLDIAYVQRHAFLSGVVAARNVPSHEPINGPALWLDYDPGGNPALSRILAALEPQADPRDEVIKGLVDAADRMAEAIGVECNEGRTHGAEFRRRYRNLCAALASAKAVQHG